MKIVDTATRAPGKCLASRDAEGPFIDTGLYARHHDPYIYLSVPWFEETAKEMLGMVPRAEIEKQFEEFQALVDAQAKRIEDLERFESAVAEYEAAKEAVAA